MRKLASKRQARKLHKEQKVTLIMVPCKLSPDGPIKATLTPDMPFDKTLNEFEFYNCNRETGEYTHFYIIEEEIK